MAAISTVKHQQLIGWVENNAFVGLSSSEVQLLESIFSQYKENVLLLRQLITEYELLYKKIRKQLRQAALAEKNNKTHIC